MKKTYLTLIALLTSGIAWSVPAAEPEQPATQTEEPTNAPQTMPMMYGHPGGMPMMGGQRPMMPGQPGMMPPRDSGQKAAGQSSNMPMGGEPGNMPMMYGKPGGMPMMQGRRGMMNPQMMQSMMAMRQQHMTSIDQHPANIEALLKQLVELQKK
jgi:hypothetical protein